jgi:hypothetical protein
MVVEGGGVRRAATEPKVTVPSASRLRKPLKEWLRESNESTTVVGTNMLVIANRGGERVGHCWGENKHGLPLAARETWPVPTAKNRDSRVRSARVYHLIKPHTPCPCATSVTTTPRCKACKIVNAPVRTRGRPRARASRTVSSRGTNAVAVTADCGGQQQ